MQEFSLDMDWEYLPNKDAQELEKSQLSKEIKASWFKEMDMQGVSLILVILIMAEVLKSISFTVLVNCVLYCRFR